MPSNTPGNTSIVTGLKDAPDIVILPPVLVGGLLLAGIEPSRLPWTSSYGALHGDEGDTHGHALLQHDDAWELATHAVARCWGHLVGDCAQESHGAAIVRSRR